MNVLHLHVQETEWFFINMHKVHDLVKNRAISTISYWLNAPCPNNHLRCLQSNISVCISFHEHISLVRLISQILNDDDVHA